MMKATARAHSNIAFIKYWGRKDELLRLPTNGSISMNLSNLHTTTTVEFSTNYVKDEVHIDGVLMKENSGRFSTHLDRIRKLAHISLKAKVTSKNTFPTATGLSSSASGFAALTVAAVHAGGLKLSEKELSILARQGSGSACRSIPHGFVEWKNGNTSNESYTVTLYTEDYWDIVDIVTIVSKQKKEISTSDSQKRADTSPFFQTRLRHIEKKIQTCKKLLQTKDFTLFGQLIESEALELHAIMLTSWPPLIHLLPETIMVMKSVNTWRKEGLPVYFTLNTGQDIHILCQKKDENKVQKKIHLLNVVSKTISNSPSKGTYLLDTHLF